MRVVAVGDSYFEPGSRMVDELSAFMGVPIEALGIRGASMRTWIQNTSAITQAAANTDLVLVHLGGNDTRPTVENAFQIDSLLKQNGASRVVWILPPSVPERSVIAEQGLKVRAALDAAGVEYLPDQPRLEVRHLRSDLVHPSLEGAKVWAEQVYRSYQRKLEKAFPWGWFGVGAALLGISGLWYFYFRK